MNEYNDIMLLDAVERYIRGEMNPDERLHFENLRKSNGEIDQLVVEHTLFLQQMNRFSEWQKFKSTVQDVHTDLTDKGEINDGLKSKAKIVYLWNKYKRVTAIAASIAGVTALTISVLVWSLSPAHSSADYVELKRRVTIAEAKGDLSREDLRDLMDNTEIKKPKEAPINYKTVATGFLIDPKGLMITNAHVVKESKQYQDI